MSRNTQRPSRKAQSRFKGVTPTASRRRWAANLTLPMGKALHLGTYDTEEEAALAYDYAARRRHGSGTFLNFRDGRFLEPIAVGEVAVVPFRRKPDATGKFFGYFLVDSEDLGRVSPYYWSWRTGSMSGKSDSGDTSLSLLLCGDIPSDHAVAHVNGDPLDNRKSNLAVIPARLHVGRHRKQTGGTTSRFKGVKKAGGRWSAQLAGRHLGTYDTEEQAARVYDRAAREHFGIYAAVNFPNDNEVGCLRKQAA